MDVKVVTAFDDKHEFENKIMEMLKQGYKIHSSTVMPNTIAATGGINIAQQKVWFYALMIKE